MTNPDSEHERKRLREFYSGMADGELLKIAGDRLSLTEVAQLILDQEINRRGLATQVVIPGIDELEKRELVTIRKFRDLPEALLAKGSLDSAGIECFLVDDNMIRLVYLKPAGRDQAPDTARRCRGR